MHVNGQSDYSHPNWTPNIMIVRPISLQIDSFWGIGSFSCVLSSLISAIKSATIGSDGSDCCSSDCGVVTTTASSLILCYKGFVFVSLMELLHLLHEVPSCSEVWVLQSSRENGFPKIRRNLGRRGVPFAATCLLRKFPFVKQAGHLLNEPISDLKQSWCCRCYFLGNEILMTITKLI